MKNIKPNLFFIISTSRSGSTMLRQLFNTHNNIAIPEREFGELKTILEGLDDYGDLSNTSNFSLFYKNTRDINFINLNKNTIEKKGFYRVQKDDWFEKINNFNIYEIYKELLISLSSFSDSTKLKLSWVGDKSPQHINYLEKIIKHFPMANFILLKRNPIDTALSQDRFSYRHFNNEYGKENIDIFWKKLQKKSNKILKVRIESNIRKILKARDILKNSNVNFMEVVYEDIISDPNYAMKSIVEFLDLKNNFDLNKFRIHKGSSGKQIAKTKIISSFKLN